MDSGQGSSEIEPETLFVPSTFPVSNQEQYIFYDFEIPQVSEGVVHIVLNGIQPSVLCYQKTLLSCQQSVPVTKIQCREYGRFLS